MKLDMDTLWDPRRGIMSVRLRFAAGALHYVRNVYRVIEINNFFFAFLCVSECFESIETHVFKKKLKANHI